LRFFFFWRQFSKNHNRRRRAVEKAKSVISRLPRWMTVFETLFFSRLAIGHATARPTDATKPSTRSRVPSFEHVRRTDNQVKNRFNSTLRRVLAAGARVGSAPSAPSAKRRRLSERDSPSSPGKSANSCETRAVAESGSENNAVVGLEQLVAASLQVERRESDGEAEDDTSTKSTNTKAHAAAGAADGEGSVRGARAFADHASLLAGMQLQQQLAQLASMAYPAFHGVSVNSMPATFPTAKVVPVTPAPAPEPSATSAMDAALVAGNSFVAALQAQLAVSHAASQVKSMWDPMQAMQYASQQAPSSADLAMAARAILAAQSMAGAPR
jgi:hypothetical protein